MSNLIREALAAVVAVALIPGVLPLFGYFALSLLNALIPGPPSNPIAKAIDRLSILCRRGAARRWSLPVFGKSVFDALRETAVEEEQKAEAPSAEPSKPEPPAGAGFALLRALGIAAVVFVVVLLGLKLTACRLPEPDGCVPWSHRCAPDGVPEVCSGSMRWTRARPSAPCPAPSVCSVETPDGGREFARCRRPQDAGTVEQ